MKMHENGARRVTALLIEPDFGQWDAKSSLAELYALTRSAGAEPFGAITQKRPSPDSATCVGRGIMEQVANFCKEYDIDLLIFDCELSQTQLRNIENISGVSTADRTMLILYIFALNAKSREGRLQAELARLKYMLPRLSGQHGGLSRLGGGIGTRGPGESKLETDRRHIRRRIDSLNCQLEELEKRRDQTSRRRKKEGIITVALVGYTNSGKSTLMNFLTNAGVLAEDRLFATLDPTARALKLPCGERVMLIDTVGFLRRLPHQLIEAFHSTLEMAASADVILNVCDASNPEAPAHLKVTNDTLSSLGCAGRPIIPVLNKCDLVPEIKSMPMIGQAVRISAKTGDGIDSLLNATEARLPISDPIELLVPYSEATLTECIRSCSAVKKEEFTPEGCLLTARIPHSLAGRVKKYIVKSSLR